jgi:EAL domain-containing protein (putative c-di-GMP-specific phosphodiesterase class I)
MGPRIDRWVVGHCFEQLARHPAHLAALGCCAINLSGHSLGFPEFFDDLLRLLKRHQIPPEKICFEVTETAAIANLGVAERSIRKLSAIGFRFALDDFGSGFSSFAYLKSLPVDTLKIDGNFVRDMLIDPLDFAVVKSIQEVAHAMGRRTIAEYVESEAIHDALRALGVDAAQGYFIGRPQPWLAHLVSK